MAEPGDLIGPFRLVSQLGRGAMGEVWRARDERLDRYVALKVLPPEAAEDLERRARMLREARAAAAIRHANVVTLFDIITHDGDDVLVMELVEGRTLSETLRRDGAPELETALRWIESVADALTAAHARGILHRDIKAANIMVAPEGLKVLDFGLAKLRDGGTDLLSTHRMMPAPTPSAERRIALDATMPSEPSHPATTASQLATRPGEARDPAALSLEQTAAATVDLDSYRTHAGQLLGTPLYMAPEQVAGALPDERSEVFSVGVLAHEIISGKPPYTATTVDELFRQITNDEPPALDVPEPVAAIVSRALAKDPAQRFGSMKELRDAVAAERRRRFAPPAKRWPLVVAAAVVLAGAAAAVVWWRSSRVPEVPPARPGDDYVTRALDEYDLFYNDKAMSSLRAALAVAPDHPRANAYTILFGGAPDADRDRAVAAARRARASTGEGTKERALLDAAIALVDQGPAAGRAALDHVHVVADRELGFWAAELDYRANRFAAARDEYQALLAEPALALRGRIYDHFSSVLLYLDEPAEALRIGKLYRDAFPGEADAVGVHATTLAAAGQTAEAIAAAEEALRLSEGEDTLAGLAKVVALGGDLGRARELYRRSLDRAGAGRRPVRRAALALLQWIDGDTAGAIATVAPCLAGGADAGARERGTCLFVAGVIEPVRAAEVAAQLDSLAAAATATRPAYGAPSSLARLVRARARFFGGACIVDPKRGDVAAAAGAPDEAAYAEPIDFYGAYHVPFFASWAVCEQAAALAARGKRGEAASALASVALRAPHREWLIKAMKSYE